MTHDNPRGFNAATLAVIDFLDGDRQTGKCFCPCHDDGTKPSLQVANGNKVLTVVHCFGRGSRQHDLEVIDYLRAHGAWPTSDALSQKKLSEPVRSPKARRSYALAIWNDVRRNRGRELAPLLRSYLKPRAIKQVPNTASIALPIEYLDSEDDRPGQKLIASHCPAMVLPIRDFKGLFQGVQVTWLNADLTAKAEVNPPRQSYGLLKGHFVELTKLDYQQPLRQLLIGEGSETGAAAMQLTELPGIASGGKTFFPHIEPPQADEYIILVDNDADGGSRRDAGQLAQRLVGKQVRIAIPDRPEDGKDGYDWNDALVDAGRDEDKLAALRQSILEAPSFASVMTDVEKREVRINALAARKLEDPLDYEQERTAAAAGLNLRVAILDEEVDRRVKLIKERQQAAPPPPNMELLAASAREIIASEDVLELFLETFSYLIAGEETNAQLLYLIGTSRLFEKCMHAAIKGPSSGGKSEIRKAVLRFFPPESVISFTSLTEKALLYVAAGFEHKILSMAEAQRHEELQFQDYLLRELLSEGKLRHLAPVKKGDKIETVTVEKQGPCSFMVTTTATKLNPENETRMLSLEVDVSEVQTKRVLHQVALIEGLNRRVDDIDFQAWHDFQRWLEAGECDVVVPFAKVLVKMIKGTWVVRWRRDIGQLLRGIKTHALLHRQHRERNSKGAIVATIQEDYAIVRDLMDDIMATTAELKVREPVIKTVEVVKRLQSREHADDERSWAVREAAGLGGVPTTEVSKELNVDNASAWRLLKQAQEAGFLVNLEPRRGRPGRYQTTQMLPPTDTDNLPEPEELERAYLDARNPVKSAEKLTKRKTEEDR
jgi:hypothetical protein